jgi:hypothetical protein
MKMNKLKILGLLLVVVAALLATVGAGSASATLTSLCKKDTTDTYTLPTCAEAHLYPAGTSVHAELEAGAKFKIFSAVATVECKKSTLEFTTEQKTEIPLGATVNAFTFGECSNNATITTIKNGTVDIELIDLPEFTHNGTLEFTGTEIQIVFHTIFGDVKCLYAPGHAVLIGGAMATISLTGKWVPGGGGGLCDANPVQVEGNYTVTRPEPLWVSM